jgi:hypothetical protein
MSLPHRSILLAATIAAAPVLASAAAPATLVACAPGYPGTTAEAQPSMDALAAAVAHRAGLPAAAVAAVYEPTAEGGLDRLRKPDAAVALVTLPFYLEHGASLRIAPELEASLQAGGPTETWTLVAKKGRVSKPADLARFTVYSIAGYAPRFVRAAPGAWGRIPESARIVASGQVLSSLRKAAAGEDVAVVLDGAQSEALPSLPFAPDLEVLARSPPLPSAIIGPVGKAGAARWPTLKRALLGLADDPQGAAALEALRMSKFVPLDPAALAAARQLVAGSAR